MRESVAAVNGINIAYQSHGDQSKPTIMLIHGLSAPLTAWPKPMIEGFVGQGFHVLLMDNRDVGRSTCLNDLRIPNLLWFMVKLKLRLPLTPPYQLDDMVEDVIGLLDHLAIKRVHVVGASMGGMIAQLLSIKHAHRVLSLTSIMSTTGNRNLPEMSAEAAEVLKTKPKSKHRQDQIDYYTHAWKVIGSPSYQPQEPFFSDYIEQQVERGIYFTGRLRQTLAILAAKNREPALAKLQLPTLVIHGDEDILVRVECGIATADSIPNAKLKRYVGMGHDIPIALIPSMVTEITALAKEED